MRGRSKLEKNFPLIRDAFDKNKSAVFSKNDIAFFFDTYLDEGLLGVRTTIDNLIDLLVTRKVLHPFTIKGPSNLQRFGKGELTSIDVAHSIDKTAYLSHETALLFNELSDTELKDIYITKEQSRKRESVSENNLTQENIDLAFSKPQRKTGLTYDWEGTNIHLLQGKHLGDLPLLRMKYGEDEISITDIEKTILDIVVRPAYAGGVEKVIEAFNNARSKMSANKLLGYLKKMDFIYPYHQSIGFYLSCTEYPEKEIKLFRNFPVQFKFYLDYNMGNYISMKSGISIFPTT